MKIVFEQSKYILAVMLICQLNLVFADKIEQSPGEIITYSDNTKVIGEIITVPFGYCPRDTFSANGDLYSVDFYPGLFNLYGYHFSYIDRQKFGMPDLRSRVPVSYKSSAQTYSYGSQFYFGKGDGKPTHGYVAAGFCVVNAGDFPSPGR